MPYADQSPDPWQRIAAEIQQLRQRVAALERREFLVPILDADPADPLPGQAWFFNDGRLRVHNADGETFTYHPGSYLPTFAASHPATSSTTKIWLRADTQNLYTRFADGSIGRFDNLNDAGGGSSDPDSGTDSNPAPAQTKSHLHRATWSTNDTGCYCPAHGRESDLRFGTFPGSAHPERRVMYANANAIASTLAGSVIRKVEIRVRTLDSWAHSGVDIRWGLHNATTLPSAFAERYSGVFTRHWPESGQATKSDEWGWVTVPDFVGAAFRDEKAAGLTINQPSSSQAFYGQMARALDLRITYTHSH